MPRINDLTGIKVGKLVVLKRADNDDYGRARWLCLCQCGNEVERKSSILVDAIKKGKESHCGCSPSLKTHGLTRANKNLHWVWAAMIQRCENKNSKDYPDYGGRGVIVCEEWRKSFKAFYEWAVKSGYKAGLTIDRTDTDGDYNPKNCTWATVKRQMNNQRKTRKVLWRGETKSVSEWSEITGISYRTLKARLFVYGWDTERAMTTRPEIGRNQHSVDSLGG